MTDDSYLSYWVCAYIHCINWWIDCILSVTDTLWIDLRKYVFILSRHLIWLLFRRNDCSQSVLYESFSPSPIWVTSLSCGEQLIDMLTCVPCVFISLTIYGHIGTFFCIISKFITQLKSTERVYKYIMHIKDKLAPYNRAMNFNISCVYPEHTHHFRTSHFIVDLNKLRLLSGEFVHLQTEQVQFVKGVTLLFKSPFGRYWITINEYYSCNYSGNVFVLLESIRESNVRLTTK